MRKSVVNDQGYKTSFVPFTATFSKLVRFATVQFLSQKNLFYPFTATYSKLVRFVPVKLLPQWRTFSIIQSRFMAIVTRIWLWWTCLKRTNALAYQLIFAKKFYRICHKSPSAEINSKKEVGCQYLDKRGWAMYYKTFAAVIAAISY